MSYDTNNEPAYLYGTMRCDGYMGVDSDNSSPLIDYRNAIEDFNEEYADYLNKIDANNT